jgi:hypothetical protein
VGLFINLFKKDNQKTEDLEEVKSPSIKENDDEIAAVIASVVACMDEEETVAAITAAIACVMGTSADHFIVRNVKRTSELDSIWSMAGRLKLMR